MRLWLGRIYVNQRRISLSDRGEVNVIEGVVNHMENVDRCIASIGNLDRQSQSFQGKCRKIYRAENFFEFEAHVDLLGDERH